MLRKGGLNNFTAQEAGNMGLGQVGSMFIKATTVATPPSGHVFIAITCLLPAVFADTNGLVAEDSSRYPNTEVAANHDTGVGGQLMDANTALGPGITIFGRWTKITLDPVGEIIAYIGK